jgi:hypothetical protein
VAYAVARRDDLALFHGRPSRVISRPLIRLALIALPAPAVLIVPAQIKSLASAGLRPAWNYCPASWAVRKGASKVISIDGQTPRLELARKCGATTSST